jgi:branched-chain amino acid transport system substrate-binding protein
MWTRWATAMTALGLGGLLATGLGCGKSGGEAPATTDEWKVGSYLSLSGPETQFGVDTREGIELAIDEVNQAGGVKGKRIKILFEDDKSKPEETNNKVLQLIDRDKVVALLGEVASGRSRVGGIAANKKKIPMITPSSTHPDITQIGPFVFRVCFTDDVQGQMGARFVVQKLGRKKVGLLYAVDDLYSSGLAKEFREEVKRLGAEIVLEKSYLKSETNYTTYIEELRAAKPEAIYAPIYYTAMIPIARQAKAAGLKGDIFTGGDGWNAEELLKDAGEEMEGAYFTNHSAPDIPWPASQAFNKAYVARYHREPSALAATGYDAAKLLADAIGRAKDGTPESIRQAIQETRNFQGATGAISIDENRNADKPVVIVQIKDRKFKYFGTVNEKTPPK